MHFFLSLDLYAPLGTDGRPHNMLALGGHMFLFSFI